MEVPVSVYSDGNHFIAKLTGSASVGNRTAKESRFRTRQAELFDIFFVEAQEKRITKQKICDYIEQRAMDLCDCEDWFVDDECEYLLKRRLRNDHKRMSTYLKKLYLGEWNYFVTFTYDDKKETEETFRLRLRKVLSNLHTRNGWNLISAWEEGEEGHRLHLHCFLYIPEGQMVGELFADKKYSTKRKRWEFFTDNSYFHSRFGQSDWRAINRNDIRGLCGYLVKYLKKSGSNLIYSRGIPSEVHMVIDTEEDIFCYFYDFGIKAILADHTVIGEKEAAKLRIDPALCFVMELEEMRRIDAEKFEKERKYNPYNSYAV